MSTQRAHEPFLSRVRALFFAHHQRPQHEPWERYLHQRNEPVYEPEPDEPPIGARQRALLAAQLREVGMEPVYLPMPRHTTGPVTPIPATPRDTDRMRQLALPAPRENREWADVTTAKELPMQHLLNVVLPGNARPVQRVPTSSPLEVVVEASDQQISNVIARLDRAQAASGQLDWLYAEPPEHTPLVLVPLDSQALAASDRTAVSALPTTEKSASALAELAELAAQFDPDKTEAAIPVCISQRARQMQRHLRESEK